MEEDISNKTIVVLVILTVIISLIGTVVVVNEISNVKMQAPKTIEKTSSSQMAQVSLGITKSPQPVVSTGLVTLEIKDTK
jgi:hypothetical protein